MAKWLVDFDSTIVDLTGHQFALVERELGLTYTNEDITSWHWEEWMPSTDALALVWGDRGFRNLDFQASLPEVPGAVAALRLLIAHSGDEFVVVSDRPDALYGVTRDWLDRHGLSPARLIFTDRERYPKAQCALAEGLTFVVEDAPHHGADLAACASVEQIYLLDYRYNRALAPHAKILRVTTWTDVLFHQVAELRRFEIPSTPLNVAFAEAAAS